MEEEKEKEEEEMEEGGRIWASDFWERKENISALMRGK